jgi:hypothetical protein
LEELKKFFEVEYAESQGIGLWLFAEVRRKNDAS